jgi:hypothetical protein
VNEREFDDWLIEAAAEVREPPATPRDEIWEGISAAREGDELMKRRDRMRSVRGLGWGIGIAALLMVGVGLGRYSTEISQNGGLAAGPDPVRSEQPSATAYRVVTAQHLTQAEALLTYTRGATDAAELDQQTIAWAKDLLSTTRLLLDSPGARDPRLRALLQDLELVLAEITQLRSGAGAQGEANEELNLVKKSMEHIDVLPRLRTAIPAGAAMSAS